MAWVGQYLKAQVELKTSVLEKMLLNCYSSSIPSDHSWHITQRLHSCSPLVWAALSPHRMGMSWSCPQQPLKTSIREPGYLKPSKLLFFPLLFSKNCMQLPTLQCLYVPLFQKEAEMENLVQNQYWSLPEILFFATGSGALLTYVLEEVLHGQPVGSTFGRRVGQLTGLFTQSVQNIWNI